MNATKMPIAEAIEQAAGELGTAAVADPIDTPPAEAAADAPEQAELFPPPPAPPFDFEKAYEDLARTEQRATNKKRTWEACKRDTKDAREAYDEALDDLHNLFIRIDQERRNALRQVNQAAAMGVAFAAVAGEQNATTEGGDKQMSDLEQTIDEEPTKAPAEDPAPECDPPATEAPTEDEGPRD